MTEGIYITGIVLIYLITLVSWYMYGKSRRFRNGILLVNLGIVMLYTGIAAIAGDDECGMDTWFCFKWYDYAILLFIFHLILFWFFMILQMIVELISKYLDTNKTK